MSYAGYSFEALLLSGVLILAQTSTKLSFEVTSVKPNNSGIRGARITSSPDGSLKAENTTVRLLLLRAYAVFDYQVVGSPVLF